MSESNPYAAPEDNEVVEVPTAEETETASAPEPEVKANDGEEVPSGTIKEVLTWVGEDKERAQAALDAEKASDSERKTLVTSLEEILGA